MTVYEMSIAECKALYDLLREHLAGDAFEAIWAEFLAGNITSEEIREAFE